MLDQQNTIFPTRSGVPFTWLLLLLNMIWIGLVAGGLYYGYRSWTLTMEGSTVQGTVVEMQSSEEDDGSYTYAPIVEYQVNGSTYRYKSHNYSNPAAYYVGQDVKLLYDKDHPEQARISNFFELWLLPMLLIPFGIADGAVSLFVLPNFLRGKAE